MNKRNKYITCADCETERLADLDVCPRCKRHYGKGAQFTGKTYFFGSFKLDRIKFNVRYANDWIERILVYPEKELLKSSFFVIKDHFVPQPLQGYPTLDSDFEASISDVVSEIKSYCSQSIQKHPLTVLLMAPPGSGKSYLAQKIGEATILPVVTANLSHPNILDTVDLAVDEVRNYKAVDKIPILFFDEVDSTAENPSMLLPLLWDGEFVSRSRRQKIGRCVIICAASSETLIEYLRGESSSRAPANYRKIEDFRSRFQHFLEVPSLENESRRSDKVMIILQLLIDRFRGPEKISPYIVQFLTKLEFTNDIRSLQLVIEALPDEMHSDDTSLKMSNNLANSIRNSILPRLRHHLKYSDFQKAIEPLRKWILQDNKESILVFPPSSRWDQE